MAANLPHGRFTYPGFEHVLSASFTFGLGIAPSVMRASIPPVELPNVLQKTGTATWSYGGETLTLPGCLVDSVSITHPNGGTVWEVIILDRRWKWQHGQITGQYNQRAKGKVVPERKKTPRELAVLCLEAMEEVNYDVSMLPDNDYPAVDWDLEVPAKALDEICSLYGCAISLRRNNTVRVVRIGQGDPLPTEGLLLSDIGFDPSNIPSRLAAVSSLTKWQWDLELEPVGVEYDSGTKTEEIKLIDQLAYTPGGGWQDENPDEFTGVSDQEQRELAKRSVWRYYRVKISNLEKREPAEDEEESEVPLSPLKDGLVEITELSQILPLLTEMVETEGKGEYEQPKEAIVWGKFHNAEGLGSNTWDDTELQPIKFEANRDRLTYRLGFSIDADRGLVIFNEPVFILSGEPNSREHEPAKLWLRTAINVYDKDTRQGQRYKFERILDLSLNAGTKFLKREDVTVEYIPEYKEPPDEMEWEDNKEDSETELTYYIDQEMQNYQILTSETATFAGFLGIEVDGINRQVTYDLNASGSTTKVSRNHEFERRAVSLADQRRQARITQTLDYEARSKRQYERDVRKLARRSRRFRK